MSPGRGNLTNKRANCKQPVQFHLFLSEQQLIMKNARVYKRKTKQLATHYTEFHT